MDLPMLIMSLELMLYSFHMVLLSLGSSTNDDMWRISHGDLLKR